MIFQFALAVFLLIVTPGPGVLSAAGVGAGFGFRAAARWVFGLFLGNMGVALIVVTGLAGIVLANPVLRLVLLGLSSAYLLYLAWRVAMAGSEISVKVAERAPGIGEAVLLQFMNPKAYVVNTTLITGFSIFPERFAAELAVKFVVFTAIWYPLHLAYSWLGGRLKELDLPPRWQRVINLVMGVSLAAVVILAILTSGII